MIIYSTIYTYRAPCKILGKLESHWDWIGAGGHVYERVVSFNATQCCDEEMNENIYVRNVLL